VTETADVNNESFIYQFVLRDASLTFIIRIMIACIIIIIMIHMYEHKHLHDVNVYLVICYYQ